MLHHEYIQNDKDGIQIRVYKIKKEEATRYQSRQEGAGRQIAPGPQAPRGFIPPDTSRPGGPHKIN